MTRTIAHLSPLLRSMDDSVNWLAIPVDEPMVAGYVLPSHFAWPPAAWARFPNSKKIRITPSAAVFGPGIQVIDVETGDATPEQVPGWSTDSRSVGQEPTAYMAFGKWAAVIRACTSVRVAVPQFWVADWNGVDDLPSITIDGVTYTAAAHQLADPATSGGDFDRSVVAAFWPGVDGGDMITQADADLIVTTLLNAKLAGPNGPAASVNDTLYWSNIYDNLLPAMKVQLATLGAAASGTVDVKQFAAALAPLLPADATPAAIGEAVVAAFEAHLTATPTTTGGTAP